MVKARTVILRGLLEALLLDSLYEEPKHGYALIKELEEAAGGFPGQNRVYTMLTELEDDGMIQGEEEPGKGGRPRLVYSLTHRGEKRLTEYKALPRPLLDRILNLWGHGSRAELAAQDDPQDDEDGNEANGHEVARVHEGRPGDGWVTDLLQRLPPDARVRCPHAQVELKRDPSTGGWTITASRADVGRHEGHEDCALCFVVQAAARVLFNPGGAGR